MLNILSQGALHPMNVGSDEQRRSTQMDIDLSQRMNSDASTRK